MTSDSTCACGDCDGGCDNVALLSDIDGDPICDECAGGLHKQDRGEDDD